jgi:hypothetical protein
MAWGEYQPDREIELDDALEALRAAAPAEVQSEAPRQPSTNQNPADITDIVSAVAQIPNNDLEWHEWKSAAVGCVADRR